MKQLNIHKTLIYVAALSILLAIIVAALAIYIFIFQYRAIHYAELYTLVVLSVLSFTMAIVTVFLLRQIAIHNIRLKQTEATLHDLNELNNTLRAQRHDFMNHLQVVHSLVELGEHIEANTYIDRVYADIEKVSSILKTGIPAVNAILEAKRQTCEGKGIDIAIAISSTLSEVPVPDWELCRVLGNIIDNSVNALTEVEGQSEPWMRIEIFEDLHSYKFKITNNGPAIKPELWERIFDTGFTTRALDGEGMGLTICHEIMNKYGGKIWVLSDEYETVFEGFVPRRA